MIWIPQLLQIQPLPVMWQSALSPSGVEYFWSDNVGVQWENPNEQFFLQLK